MKTARFLIVRSRAAFFIIQNGKREKYSQNTRNDKKVQVFLSHCGMIRAEKNRFGRQKFMITAADREILRALAQRQLEAHHSPKNQERMALWKRHNACQGERPIIHIEMDTFEQEIIPPLLRCEGETARQLETALYRNFLNLTLLDDDWVVPDYFPVVWRTWFHPLGHEITRTFAGGDSHSLGHQFNYVITDLEEDWEQVQPSRFGVDRAATQAYFDAAQEAFGDILPPKFTMGCLYSVPTQDVVHLMGMENMCFAMYDYPELFHQMMDKLTDDYLAYFKFMKDEGILHTTTGFEMVGQGTLSFTDELPADEAKGNGDVWGFMDSQETVSISPDMYGEFIFPYYRKVASTYGLLSYGCCEPVNPVWDYVKQLGNLRKVSCSPWCDEAFMAEQLRGTKTIFHRKPSPNFLGVGETLDEEGFRQHIRHTLTTAAGCHLEITQRDVYTINNDIAKAQRYVAIIREEIENHWKP